MSLLFKIARQKAVNYLKSRTNDSLKLAVGNACETPPNDFGLFQTELNVNKSIGNLPVLRFKNFRLRDFVEKFMSIMVDHVSLLTMGRQVEIN